MDQADAELLEQIGQGDRIFRPGPGELGQRSFQALVGHLRELRDRGLIDMPERSVSAVESHRDGAGAEQGEGRSLSQGAAAEYLMAGPCYVTDMGRAVLETFRRGDRRMGDRRQADRRQGHDPSAIPAAGDRRRGNRRQGDRRWLN